MNRTLHRRWILLVVLVLLSVGAAAGSAFAQPEPEAQPGAEGQVEPNSAAPVAPEAAPGAEVEVPEPPEEYESPRATLATFYEAMNQGLEGPKDEEAWELIFGAMQMPETAGEARESPALNLLGVFNNLGRILPARMAPGVEEVVEEDLESFEFFPDNPYPAARDIIEPAIEELGPPPSEIVLVKTESGAWKFSNETLGNINLLYSWIEGRGLQYGADIRALSPAAWLRAQMPSALKNRFVLGLELWQWLGLAVLLLAAVLADLLSRLLLAPIVRRVTRRNLGEPDAEGLSMVLRAVGLAIGAVVFLALLFMLGITGIALTVLLAAGKIVLIVALAWAGWAVTDMVAAVMFRRVVSTPSSFHHMLIPLVRKTIKLFIVAMALLYVAATFEINLLPLIGSLGLAGLAISFAAQGMVANLFGGLTIFMDRPYKVGERIKYKGYDGVIEEVGFRITRLRTLTGHLVTIPNGGVTTEPVENVSRRPGIQRIMNVTITYDTPPAKIEQAVQIIRDILEEPDIAEPVHGMIGGEESPPHVYFNDLNADSLNIFVFYWYTPPAWWDYLAHAHRVNLRIFEEFEKAGIEFAFPTQTLYLAGDPKRELAVKVLGADLGGQG